MKQKVRFVLYTAGSHKLAMVKAVKFLTGFGLKESKEWVDSADTNSPNSIILDVSIDSLNQFKKELSHCVTSKYQFEDRQKNRQKKLAQLGLLPKEEMAEILAEEDIIAGWNSENMINILKMRYLNLDENYLKESIEKLP